MAKIKFSYPFSKLFNNTKLVDQACLLQVLRVDLSDITEEMRNYDTDYGAYKLPTEGAYLLLIFMKPAQGGLFTTLRRDKPSGITFDYYMELVGQWFDLDVSHAVNVPEE